MRKEFLDFINKLMEHDQKFTDSIITDDIKEYLKILYTSEEDKSELTDSGKVILKYMQDNDVKIGKAKDIANGLGVSSRTVSGSLRKLVADGFVEKVSKDPVVYAITDKGKNYKID
jgi:Mn-dependent DtxR family transcriptional regulator